MGLFDNLMAKLQPAKTWEENKKLYFNVLLEAMEDGVLTNDEIEELDQLRKKLRLTIEDVAGMKLRAFQVALNSAMEDGIITPKEEKDLEKIKAYLGIREGDVAKNKGALMKMRMLYEIHKGNLPLIEIAGLALQPREVAHMEEHAEQFWDEQLVVRPEAHPQIKPGLPYVMGAKRPQTMPTEQLEQVGTGTMIITNQRILFHTGNPTVNFGMRYERMTSVLVFTNGFGLYPDNAGPRFVRINDVHEIEMMAGMISRFLNPPSPPPPPPPEKAGPTRTSPRTGPRKPTK